MNPQEQRNHRRVTDELETGLVNVTKAMADRCVSIERSVEQAREEARSLWSAEATHRLQLSHEQRAFVDRADAAILRALSALRDRDCLGRMRWLFRGK